MQSRRRRKKVGGGRCGRRARRSRSSVRPMPIEIADGAPVSGDRGNTAAAAVPCTSALENGNGAGLRWPMHYHPDPRRHGQSPTRAETDAHADLFRTIAARSAHDAAEHTPRTVAAMPSAQADARCLPAYLCQPAAFERSGSILADVDAMTIETGPSEASPLRGVREMAAAVTRCVSD